MGRSEPRGSGGHTGELGFDGELYELASNYPHVINVAMDVPASVSGAFGRRSHVPVVGTADGVPLTATLVPVGEGRHRLFLNGQVRRAIGKGPGDRVEIRVRLDTSDRMPEMPTDLDIFRSARLIVRQHGQDAVHEAARRSDALRDKGDLDGQATWLRVRKAVLELLKPGDGDVVH